MGWRFRIARVFGIDVYIHWTFVLLLALLFVGGVAVRSSPDPLRDALHKVALTLAVFFCVVLHEFGHALTARLFGIRTRDIVVLPFGGVARLERFRYTPTAELVVTIAGPLVNVLIAIVLGVVLIGMSGSATLTNRAAYASDFLNQLFAINILLVLFNMIPSFPMDGGRVLRSLLAYVCSFETATVIAGRLGQIFAAGFVALGLYSGQFMLAVIGFFGFSSAAAEIRAARVRAPLQRLLVRDVLRTEFPVLAPTDPAGAAAGVLSALEWRQSPVLEGGRLVGMIEASGAAHVAQTAGADAHIAPAVRQDIPAVAESATAEDALEMLQTARAAALPVLRDGVLVGLITIPDLARAVQRGAARVTPAGAH